MTSTASGLTFPFMNYRFRTLLNLGLLNFGLLLLGLNIGLSPALALASDERAQTVVHMLDYLGVDYPSFVRDGEVLDPSEYSEQLEFATQAGKLIADMPTPSQQQLLAEAEKLRFMIENKAEGSQVSALAGKLRSDVIAAYKLTVAPRKTPDLNRGNALFGSHCIACHGATGRGDGPLAADLEPRPSNFHQEDRMRQRSIYGLYNTISLGVEGTPMRAFVELTDEDRWSLAFYVSSLRATPQQLSVGESVWKASKEKNAISSLKDLVITSPEEAVQKLGDDGLALQAFLTAHPEVLVRNAPTPIAIARAKLEESLQAYRNGQQEAARQLAISAYLEGFELIESSLNNIDPQLRQQVEREMMGLRADIAKNAKTTTIAEDMARIDDLLDKTEERLSGDTLSPATAFVSSLAILLREGLEAVLVLAAIIAFISKTGRKDALRYIHFGWVLAVVLGILTWVVANYLLTISGASRELTEGISALVATAMLLYIGYWLHSKSHAHAWQQFIRDKVNAALGQKTLWTMAGISFLAVYREIFETILFYEALWGQVGNDGHAALLGGIAVAVVLLTILTWAILKYSVRLPLGRFFSGTSTLMGVLAVIFAGNGIKALQEAGIFEATAVHFFSAPLLGIFPTAESLGTQVGVIAVILVGMFIARRQQMKAMPSPA